MFGCRLLLWILQAHMRFCWLKSKFEDNPEISQINQRLNFVVMDFFPAQNALLQDHLFTPFTVNDQEIPFDGILFYHREGHYVFHSTPLVGWLKVFMLPEILHIDVHPSHLHNKPQDYESIQQYLSSKKKKKRKEKETEDLVIFVVTCILHFSCSLSGNGIGGGGKYRV